jgi:hypothetical protein
VRPVRPLIAAILLAAAAAVPLRADFTSAINTMMSPYYAALLASHRGDAESTQRDLVLLAAKWELVTREAPPAAIASDPQWPAAVGRVKAIIERSRELVRVRNLDKAHLELEALRLVLREVRGRHNLLVLDDYLTDYHESMERIVVRASMQNEIVLAEADFAEMTRDLGKARLHWATVEQRAGAAASAPGWAEAARRIVAAQAALEKPLAAKDPRLVAQAAEQLTDAYHDLLGVLVRLRRQ